MQKVGAEIFAAVGVKTWFSYSQTSTVRLTLFRLACVLHSGFSAQTICEKGQKTKHDQMTCHCQICYLASFC